MNTQTSERPFGARHEQTRMIQLDGRRLAITCAGEGAPAVVLETGLGAESSEWAPVQHAIAPFARVFRYDRAGRGSSDAPARPRSAKDMVDELHRLLKAADIAPPYILVGHSFGGLLMRLYAHHHRDETAGLVLVDSMHEDQFDVFGPTFPSPTAFDPPALVETRAFWQGGWRSPDSTLERIDLVASIEQAKQVGSLGAVPVTVIIAGTMLHQPLLPEPQRPVLQRRWQDLQMQFMRLSSRANATLALNSGHFVQRDDPDAVIEAIKASIREVAGVAA